MNPQQKYLNPQQSLSITPNQERHWDHTGANLPKDKMPNIDFKALYL